ncbi:hypothetical protein ACFWFI_35960 [Streptomyces sp. NPDC060209]|uniref:hypothetical protein n=1 Tax=Streptomyces sp. NPDC060209 TaxID=3347073 RepID=UPI003657A344
MREPDAPVALIAGTVLIAIAQGLCSAPLVPRSLESCMGRGTVERPLPALGAVLMLANTAGLLGLVRMSGPRSFPSCRSP